MAIYDGVPTLRLEGDRNTAFALIPRAKALLYRVQEFKKTAGVNTFALTQRVGDFATIYALSTGGVNILHIAAEPDVPEQLRTDEPEPGIVGKVTRLLNFYSGLIFTGILTKRRFPGPNDVEREVLENFSPTTPCRLHHEELRVAGPQPTSRLAVEPWPVFAQELSNPNPNSPARFSQYTRLRSSMYSGTMAKVVQLVMGLGRVRMSSEEKTPYLKDIAHKGVQIRYDWRFIRTHGVVQASDGKPWLVEISSARGVLARPLPVFEDSTTEGFAARALLANDMDMQYVLDELGYVPTGEAFPARSSDLEKLITAGDVLRLMDGGQLAPFYRCSPYSSALGWAFSNSGVEAHNTAYYFGDDGFQRGVWYQISISIGATRNNRLPNEPIASGSANLRLQREGYIYTPPVRLPSYARYVPIKFYEPMIGGLLSHEGVPDISAAGLPVPYVDTPMFVALISEELHVVSYFRDNQSYPGGVEDELDGVECPYNGRWNTTTTYSDFRVSPAMHSNVYDPRELFPASQRVQTLVSRDRGSTAPSSGFTDRFNSSLNRSRKFETTSSIKDVDGKSNAAAVAIPQFSRSAYYFAFGETSHIGFDYVLNYWVYLDDPHRYHGRNDGVGPELFSIGRGVVEVRGVPGAPVDNPHSSIDYAVARVYEDWEACSVQYADDGPWFQLGNTFYVLMPGERTPPSTSRSGPTGSTSSASLRLYSNGINGFVTLPVTFSQVENHWMTPSPDPVTRIIQNIRAESSSLGLDAVVYDENLSSYAGESKFIGVAPSAITDNQFPTFIGVNRP